jgi:superfamily II DNA or RNA helicase
MDQNSNNLTETLVISQDNAVNIKIDCYAGATYELQDFFTFQVPGATFMPAYRNKMWDGKIRLYNVYTRRLYAGLLPYVEEFASSRGYDIVYDESVEGADDFSLHEAEEFSSQLGLPFIARDYQLGAFTHAVRNKRCLLLSPTASGKSLIIYHIVRWYNAKTLLIVPTTSLVHQMVSDFKEYGWNADEHCHKVMAGCDKVSDKQVIVSTWQSIYKMPKEYFDQFDVVIGDEAHQFKAKSLGNIMEKLEDCKYRFGLTGTLDGTQTHKLVLEGLFGVVKKVITTKELMDNQQLSAFKIKVLALRYPEEVCQEVVKFKYQEEMDYIVRHEKRNKFIRNLALSLEGNTLLLFQYVEKHGKVLYEDILNKAADGRKVFFVSGDTDAETRENIRAITESENDAIIVASFGTFSTGINIRNLHNIIFASPTKSRIRNLQSIGRGLRLGANKEEAVLFDIVDDFHYKSKKNFTLEHFVERMKIYNEEKFKYKIYRIDI